MGWFIVSLSGKERKGQTVGIHELNYSWCHSTFPMVRVFRHIHWHISLDHCLVLLLPMRSIDQPVEHHQPSGNHHLLCKVQAKHPPLTRWAYSRSYQVWTCSLRLTAQLEGQLREFDSLCEHRSSSRMKFREEGNMSVHVSPSLVGRLGIPA